MATIFTWDQSESVNVELARSTGTGEFLQWRGRWARHFQKKAIQQRRPAHPKSSLGPAGFRKRLWGGSVELGPGHNVQQFKIVSISKNGGQYIYQAALEHHQYCHQTKTLFHAVAGTVDGRKRVDHIKINLCDSKNKTDSWVTRKNKAAEARNSYYKTRRQWGS